VTEIFFVFLYGIEQLLILLLFPKFNGDLSIFLGVSVLIVLTTIAVDKLLLKRNLERKNKELIYLKGMLIEKEKKVGNLGNLLKKSYENGK